MATNLTIFKTETANKVLQKINESKGRNNGIRQGSSGPPKAHIVQEYRVAKVVSEVKDTSSPTPKAGGYYKMMTVNRNDTDPIFENQEWYDGPTTFVAFEVTGATGISVDEDKAYLCFSTVSASGQVFWNFSRGGGGGSRAYVVITAVTDAANYVGDVIAGPDDPTIITADVAIKVKNATANEFAIGYPNFADVVGDVYWLDGFVLG